MYTVLYTRELLLVLTTFEIDKLRDSQVSVSQQSQISPDKKQEDESENGSAEQDLGGCVYQPVAVDCRVGQFINIPLLPPNSIACVDVVVLGGARDLLHHQGFTGEETFEDSPWAAVT